LQAVIGICTVYKLSTDFNTILYPIFTQQAGHKFGCNTMHAQIFSENLTTRAFLNSSFLCYYTKGQTTIGTKHFPNFMDDFFIF